MLDWLKRRTKTKSLPEYAELRLVPDRERPANLAAMLDSDLFNVRHSAIQEELCKPNRRPLPDERIFVQLAMRDDRSVVIDPPNNQGRCWPVFSSPLRSFDYVRVLLAKAPPVSYHVSSAIEIVEMLRRHEETGTRSLVLDRCPRCSDFTVIRSRSVQLADDILNVWSIIKATAMARADLYLNFALESARAGQLQVARDLGLQAVGHVSAEDARSHFLLGEIAVGLGDRRLLQDAKAFLYYLSLDVWAQKLDRLVESGRPDFERLELEWEFLPREFKTTS